VRYCRRKRRYDPLDGWIKLIRARTVLGEQEAAKEALNQALVAFAGADEEKSRILAAARELGVNR
jgi:cytochrome c-type biogenesis protein CcmH